jgi:quaternary ammonium compound-resistance protein SugE
MTPQATSWLALGIALVLEISWVMNPKRLGWERPLLPASVLAVMGLTYWFPMLAVAHVPVGVAYPIWTGLGAGGAVAAG